MLLVLAQAFCVIIFGLTVFLEMLAASARPAGSIAGRNSMGYSVSVIINTFKRMFLVSYPPALGAISAFGGAGDLLMTILLCYLFSFLPMLAATLFRAATLIFMVKFIVLYSRSGRLLLSVRGAVARGSILESSMASRMEEMSFITGRRGLFDQFDGRILALATWVFAFYSASIFSINILGEYFSEYSSIIYQLVGFVNAFGTLVWAFFLDPALSRRFDASRDVLGAYNSLLIASWLANIVFAPLLILGIVALLKGLS